MGGDALRLGVALVEELGRPAMGRQPLSRLDRLVDGGTHDGWTNSTFSVDTCNRSVRASELAASDARCLVVELRELGRMLELGAVAEHGDRHGQPPRLGGERDSRSVTARVTAFRPDLAYPPGVLGRRREALAVDRVEDRPQEQRVAAGGRVARDDERLLGLDLELVPGQRATEVTLNAVGLITSAEGSAISSVSSSFSTLCSGGRRPRTTTSGSPSSRRAR